MKQFKRFFCIFVHRIIKNVVSNISYTKTSLLEVTTFIILHISGSVLSCNVEVRKEEYLHRYNK